MPETERPPAGTNPPKDDVNLSPFESFRRLAQQIVSVSKTAIDRAEKAKRAISGK